MKKAHDFARYLSSTPCAHAVTKFRPFRHVYIMIFLHGIWLVNISLGAFYWLLAKDVTVIQREFAMLFIDFQLTECSAFHKKLRILLKMEVHQSHDYRIDQLWLVIKFGHIVVFYFLSNFWDVPLTTWKYYQFLVTWCLVLEIFTPLQISFDHVIWEWSWSAKSKLRNYTLHITKVA